MKHNFRTEHNKRINLSCVEEHASTYTKELISESIDKDMSAEIYYNAYKDGRDDTNTEWIKRIIKCSGIAVITAVVIKKIRD